MHGVRAADEVKPIRDRLIADGMPAEAIESYLAAHAKTDDASDIEVLEDNWKAVQVYKRCKWQIGLGFSGAAYLGIDAIEIESASRGCGYEFDLDIFDSVRFMAGEAAPILNKQGK